MIGFTGVVSRAQRRNGGELGLRVAPTSMALNLPSTGPKQSESATPTLGQANPPTAGGGEPGLAGRIKSDGTALSRRPAPSASPAMFCRVVPGRLSCHAQSAAMGVLSRTWPHPRPIRHSRERGNPGRPVIPANAGIQPSRSGLALTNQNTFWRILGRWLIGHVHQRGRQDAHLR